MKPFNLIAMLGVAMATPDFGNDIQICNWVPDRAIFNLPFCELVSRDQLIYNLANGWWFENVSDHRVARHFMELTSEKKKIGHPHRLPVLVHHKDVEYLLSDPHLLAAAEVICESIASDDEELLRLPTCEQHICDRFARDRDEL